jgi:hypothetical protein
VGILAALARRPWPGARRLHASRVQRARNGSLKSHQKQELAALVDASYQRDFILKINISERKQLLIY